jgi:hypothetical protein
VATCGLAPGALAKVWLGWEALGRNASAGFWTREMCCNRLQLTRTTMQHVLQLLHVLATVLRPKPCISHPCMMPIHELQVTCQTKPQ